MQPSILNLSCSLLLCLLVNFASAQKEKKPEGSKEKKRDSLAEKFYPRALRIGTDLITLIKSQTLTTFTGYEFNGDIDFGKYYLAADYGSWGRMFDLSNGGNYKNNGTYWRVGWDINILKKDPDRNMFFIGFRYGHASFTESATIITPDPVFGEITQNLKNNNAIATWGELTTGLRVKIWKEFWMGYTARMKFAPGVTGDNELKSYDIPGYGMNQKGFYWGFNYQIFWRVPFKKQKKPATSLPK